MSLSNLPNEILFEIVKHLDFLPSFHLRQTNRDFCLLLTPKILDFLDVDSGYGMAALCLAAAFGDEDLIRLLLVKGKEVTIIDGSSAVRSQSEAFNVDHTVQLLLRKGAKIEIWDGCYEKSVLHWAVLEYQEDILRLLLEKGINVNMANDDRVTALHRAVCLGGEDGNVFTKLLIENGAYINHTNIDGSTPLHYAATNHLEATVRILVEHGADRSIRDRFGETALDTLERGGWYMERIIELLDPREAKEERVNIWVPKSTAERWLSRRGSGEEEAFDVFLQQYPGGLTYLYPEERWDRISAELSLEDL